MYLKLWELHKTSLPYNPYTPPVTKLSLPTEVWTFLCMRKKWWLLPMLVVIVFFGLLLAFAQTSPFAPFIYTLV